MRIHRFYIENIEISPENIVVTHETDLIHQLKNVFRYKPGQLIHIFNEKVGEIEVELIDITKKDMSFKYIRQIRTENVSHVKRQITLYMSIIKNSNFDLVVEKAVELGISTIVPVTTERTIKDNLNIDRLNRIIKEATEQSGRIDLLMINDTLNLEDAIKDAKGKVCYGSVSSNDVEKPTDIKDNDISVFIGPEGGYSEAEIVLFNNHKVIPLRLGENVLRAETAAIVACGLLAL